MSLSNFSLPFGILPPPGHAAWPANTSPLHPVHQLVASTNNLLYSPAAHQQQPHDGAPPPPGAEFYKNNPYAAPQLHQPLQRQHQPFQYKTNNNHNNQRKGSGVGNAYLPPPPAQTGGVYQHQHQSHQQQQQQQQISNINNPPHFNNHNKNVQAASAAPFAGAAAAAAAVTKPSSRTYGEGSYSRFPFEQPQDQRTQQQQPQQQQQRQYFNSFSTTKTQTTSTASFNTQQTATTLSELTPPPPQQQQQPPPPPPQQQQQQHHHQQSKQANCKKVDLPPSIYGAVGASDVVNADAAAAAAAAAADAAALSGNNNEAFPERPPGFTRVHAGQGSRTQVHAVLDYDVEEGEEDYFDEHDQGAQAINGDARKKSSMPTVTPIQGPIFLKNGTVPVVPLFSYPTVNNGSFVQIPIWWTALSVALGLDVRGDVIKGVPCIKRYHQLFCPTAGNSYPIDKIERFIDDNKALMRRMYGDFEMNMDPGGPPGQEKKQRRRRFIDEPDLFLPPGAFPSAVEEGDSYFGKLRDKRQAHSANQRRAGGGGGGAGGGKPTSFGRPSAGGPGNPGSSTGRLDACESKVEIVTPYWASNSAGKIRAIVNTQHFEQAIHQEICSSKAQTPRCKSDCGCEQKYKWHRLLAYDPDNDCKGIFMDWFLFPSCCVCRCNP